jgi:hypothetical protein
LVKLMSKSLSVWGIFSSLVRTRCGEQAVQVL